MICQTRNSYFIVGSMQVYIADLMLPLVNCMASLVGEGSLIYLAYYERSAAAAKLFWEILPKYFTFEKVLEERYGASFHPCDVGVFQLHLIPQHARKEGTPADVAASTEGHGEEASSLEVTPANVAGAAAVPEVESSSREGTPANVAGSTEGADGEPSSKEQVKDKQATGADGPQAARHMEEGDSSQGQLQEKPQNPGLEQ
jgi:hypothetical protein